MNLLTKLSYGIGQLSDGVKQAAFGTFLFFYYNQVLGLSGSLAGAAALLALLVDAITDPMVGQLSDRFRSRWGRRHQFMLAGALPFGLAMVAIFSPPEGLDQSQLFAWMLIGAITVRLMLTLFFVPHLSLGAELVRDYHGRTSLIGYRVFLLMPESCSRALSALLCSSRPQRPLLMACLTETVTPTLGGSAPY